VRKRRNKGVRRKAGRFAVASRVSQTVGPTFYAEAAIFGPAASNRIRLTTSNALECVIGYR